MIASSGSKFSWRKGCILLLLLIGAILAYDINKHGTFESSSTGKFLQRSGIYSYGQSLSHIKIGAKEFSVPEYYKAAVDTCKPYFKLVGDFYIVIKVLSARVYENAAIYVKKNGPVVAETIEHYLPGMLGEIRLRSEQGLDLVKVYSAVAAEKIIEHSSTAIRWLEHNVFVGKLSPENLQKYATHAIDTTQTLASQTYDWVYEKVQTLSKLP